MRRTDKLFRLMSFVTKNYPNIAEGHAAMAAAWAMKAERSTKFTWKLRQAAEALKASERAISLDENCSLAYFVRGVVDFYMPSFMGKLEEASESFEKILKVRDSNKRSFLVETYYYLALTYRRMRKNDKALKVLERAMKLFPNYRVFRNLYTRYGGK